MKAIILAAGQAKRLRPLTDRLPKCLLRLGNKTILDYQIDALNQNKITKIILVVGFEAKKIIAHLRHNYPSGKFTFIRNPKFETTGPAYSLRLAKKYLKQQVLYLNSDSVFDPAIIKRIIKSKKDSVTATQQVPWDEEEVNVVLDKENRVFEIGKQISRELSCGEFIGVTKLGAAFNRKLLASLDEFTKTGETKKFAADGLNRAIQHGGKLFSLDVTGLPAIEIDTLEDYTRAKRLRLFAGEHQK